MPELYHLLTVTGPRRSGQPRLLPDLGRRGPGTVGERR